VLRRLGLRILRASFSVLVELGSVSPYGAPSRLVAEGGAVDNRPLISGRTLSGPPPGHPERVVADAPLTEREQALWAELAAAWPQAEEEGPA
jgi:hypothetical protein